jgi:SAM-dependent methyltransferase
MQTDTIDERVIGDIQALVSSFRSTSRGDGHFWDALSAKHTAMIREFGFGNFKRTINFEYCQWGVRYLRDPKIPRLIRRLLRDGVLPVGGLLATCDYKDAAFTRWPDGIDPLTGAAYSTAGFGGRSRLRAYTFYCGLLWQYARHHDRLHCLDKIAEPTLGNPMPIRYRGRLISQDLALCAVTLNRMAAHVPMGKVRRVLEIGAGYGRLAHMFRAVFPEIEYTILDIPPALAVSKNYLGEVLGEDSVAAYFGGGFRGGDGRRVNFIPANRIDEIPDGYFDLVINISSFDEMAPGEVRDYFTALDRIASGWLYLQGYGKSIVPGRRLGLDELPYEGRWREVYGAPDPVASRFVEKVLKKAAVTAAS